MQDVWRIVRDPAPLWRAWDGEIVIYNVVTGSIHRFEPLAAEVFDLLNEMPSDLDALCERVTASLGLEKSAQLNDTLRAVLRQFQGFGIVEPEQVH